MKFSSSRLELSSSCSSFPFIPSSSSKISKKPTQKSGMPTFELFFFFVSVLVLLICPFKRHFGDQSKLSNWEGRSCHDSQSEHSISSMVLHLPFPSCAATLYITLLFLINYAPSTGSFAPRRGSNFPPQGTDDSQMFKLRFHRRIRPTAIMAWIGWKTPSLTAGPIWIQYNICFFPQGHIQTSYHYLWAAVTTKNTSMSNRSANTKLV